MARIGGMTCPMGCGNPDASVSENATGTLSVKCHRCEFSGFASKGTKAARTIRAKMLADDDGAPPDRIEPPATAPAARKGSGLVLG